MAFLEYGFKHWVVEHFPLSDYRLSRKVASAISIQSPDSEISSFLATENAGLIGRLGGTEARYLGALLKNYSDERNLDFLHSRFAKYDLAKRQRGINRDSGFFFLNRSEELKFLKIYLEALIECNILGVWGTAFAWVESLALKNADMKMIPLGATAPWVHEYPYSNFDATNAWAKSLQGKKVLVVSPFAKSIEEQFSNIDKCFPGVEYPEFELLLLAPPVSYGFAPGEGISWFKMLQETIDKIHKINFDIALVGAGAYSLPVAHAVKKMGRVGIHTGGGTQIFFGVMGNRWNNSLHVKHFLNEFWIRPAGSEIPNGHSFVEDSCYW